jgi:bacteriocin-like protein
MITEMSMHELTDTELDAVSGGLFNFNFGNIVVQPNIGLQVGLNLFSLADLQQQLGQLNTSVI